MVGHSWNIVPNNTFHTVQIRDRNAVFVFTQNAVSERFDKKSICCRINFSKRNRLIISKTIFICRFCI